jgi:hypothetical protein
MVILDNSTRWNSIYHSLHRGLKLRSRLTLFCIEYKEELGKDFLSEDDWKHLTEIAAGLQPFHEATLRVEGKAGKGHHGSVWEVLPTLEALLSVMEEGKQDLDRQRKGKSPLAVAYQNAWEKLRKYYSLTDGSHNIYAAATLFNPTRRKTYFDEQWVTKR